MRHWCGARAEHLNAPVSIAGEDTHFRCKSFFLQPRSILRPCSFSHADNVLGSILAQAEDLSIVKNKLVSSGMRGVGLSRPEGKARIKHLSSRSPTLLEFFWRRKAGSDRIDAFRARQSRGLEASYRIFFTEISVSNSVGSTKRGDVHARDFNEASRFPLPNSLRIPFQMVPSVNGND